MATGTTPNSSQITQVTVTDGCIAPISCMIATPHGCRQEVREVAHDEGLCIVLKYDAPSENLQHAYTYKYTSMQVIRGHARTAVECIFHQRHTDAPATLVRLAQGRPTFLCTVPVQGPFRMPIGGSVGSVNIDVRLKGLKITLPSPFIMASRNPSKEVLDKLISELLRSRMLGSFADTS